MGGIMQDMGGSTHVTCHYFQPCYIYAPLVTLIFSTINPKISDLLVFSCIIHPLQMKYSCVLRFM